MWSPGAMQAFMLGRQGDLGTALPLSLGTGLPASTKDQSRANIVPAPGTVLVDD